MKLRAYVMEVSERGVVFSGYFREIENSAETLRKWLGGAYELVRLEDEIVILCRRQEDSLPLNRMLVKEDEKGRLLRGSLLCLRCREERFYSLREEDEAVIRERLKPVFCLNGRMVIGE